VNSPVLRRSFRKNFPAAIRGEGVYVWDAAGNKYLDLSGSAAVNFIGHGVPEISAAMAKQAAKLEFVHTSQFTTPVAEEYAEELLTFAGEHFRGGAVYFTSGGSESIETALKLAMHVTGREKFIAFFNSFHGRTLGSLSLTSSKVAQRLGFKRQVLDVVHVPYPNEYRNPFSADDCEGEGAGRGALNWIEKRLFKTTTPPQEVAGIVVEVVQGEGGYVPATKLFFDGLRRIC